MRRDIALPAIAGVFLRLALAATFADSVCDRLGIWGPPGSPHVAWGDFGHFEAYVRILNWFLPAALIPAIAWTVTILETGLAVALALGLWLRWTAIAGGALLLVFALAMSAALGPKAALDYSVYSASAGAFLLASVRQHAHAVENPLRLHLRNAADVAESVARSPKATTSTLDTNLYGSQPPGVAALACRRDELTREEWSRRDALHEALKRSTEEVIETSDGWAFRLRADPAVFSAAAEWLTLERRCCPFLRFELRWAGAAGDPWLRLEGGEGVKDYLAPGSRALMTRIARS